MIAGGVTQSATSSKRLKLGFMDRCARSFLFGWLRRLKHGRVVLRGDGTHMFGEANLGCDLRAVIDIRDGCLYRKIASGGILAAAEAYIRGDWDCADLTSVFRIVLRNRQAMDGLNRVSRRWRVPIDRLWHRLRSNSPIGSRKNISAHYDLGNELFELFLDETLSYSCGVFPSERASMADASWTKNEIIGRRLNLSPSDHVLEIGSGWGGFAIHAARRFGCRVTTTTISRAQYEVAQERIRLAGLQDRVTLLLQDYRQLRGQFDKLVSIEMIEAVGYAYLPEYFQVCRRLLKPDGVMLLQAILMSDRNFETYRTSVDFIQRYIFPGGFLPSLGAICAAMAKTTDLGLVHYHDITQHYPPTLRNWQRRFQEKSDQLRDLGYPRSFQRMWNYYFSYCEAAFLERHVTCAQIALAGPAATWENVDCASGRLDVCS